MVTHHSAKFNSRRFCGSRDITYLIYHVTLQDLAKFGGHSHCGSVDIFLVCHAIS